MSGPTHEAALHPRAVYFSFNQLLKQHRHTEMPRAPSQSTNRMNLEMNLGGSPGESWQSLRQSWAFSTLGSTLSRLPQAFSTWTLSHWYWTQQEKIIISLSDLCGLGMCCWVTWSQEQWADSRESQNLRPKTGWTTSLVIFCPLPLYKTITSCL